MSRFTIMSVLLVFLFTASIAYGQGGVVGWRGDGTGRYPKAQPLLEWSDSKNVIWRTEMKGESNATPTIVGDRLFTTIEPFTVACVSTVNGDILWKNTLRYEDVFSKAQLAEFAEKKQQASGILDEIKKFDVEIAKLNKGPNRRSPEVRKAMRELRKKRAPLDRKYRSMDMLGLPRKDKTNGYATPTPVSDGKHVYFLLATGVAACFDMDGKRKWAVFVEKPTNGWGHSSSPLLAGGKLIVHVLRPIALDVKTGKEVWRAKSGPRWGSPVLARIDDRDVIVTPNGEMILASDGTVLTRSLSKVTYCAPVVTDGIVYFVENGGKAIQLPDTVSGKPQFKPLWKTKLKNDRYYASPIVHDGLIYAVTRYSTFSVIDAIDGKVVYEKKLDAGKGQFYPSISLGGKHLFVSIDNGTTLVLEPGREYKEVTRNTLEPFRSTPIFVGKRMYIRGLKHMYCIGPK